MSTTSLVVLAAGIGSRYGGLKQMDPFGPSGEFIVDYSVFDTIRSGFDRVVFVIRKELEQDFKATIGSRVARHVRTDYVYQALSDLPAGYQLPAERQKPWGTGHAVLSCARVVDGPFAVINADDFYGRDGYAQLGAWLSRTAADEARYSLVGFVLRNTLSDHGAVARGICDVGSDGVLRSVVERTRIERAGDAAVCPEQTLTGDEIVSMNMWGFKPSLFGYLEDEFRRFLDGSIGDLRAEFFIPTVVNTLVARKAVSVDVLRSASAWFGVTNRDDKAVVVERISELIREGVYPESLWG